MSNPYATVSQLFAFFDQRVMLDLSGDQNAHEGNSSTIQFLLDAEASVFESRINGLYAIPLTNPPLAVTQYVCVRVAYRLYARRNDIPDQIQKDSQAADEWLNLVAAGSLIIPGQALLQQPTLQVSGNLCGASEFWDVYGQPDNPFSTAINQGALPRNGS